jgi:hypothetical protein
MRWVEHLIERMQGNGGLMLLGNRTLEQFLVHVISGLMLLGNCSPRIVQSLVHLIDAVLPPDFRDSVSHEYFSAKPKPGCT